MALIQVSGTGHRRQLDHELPLMPFIDFMLCLLAFLMMTAIWTQMARLKAAADGSGQSAIETPVRTARLHVTVRDKSFDLAWRNGSTVIDTRQVSRSANPSTADAPRYPALGRALSEEWERHGSHRAANDPQQDQAVLHTSNALAFDEIVAVMDALNATKRTNPTGAPSSNVSAFAVSFAAD
jgi:biopolymer transport protein ExbD